MPDSNIDEAVSQFESKLKASTDFRFRRTPENHKKLLLKTHIVNSFDIKNFLSIYRQSSSYQKNSEEKLVKQLMDIKLQMYLIEVDLGADNDLMQLIDREPETHQKKAHIELLQAGFNQSLILKSRILWERVMNFVYFLETSEDLKPKGNRRSKKTAFFEFIQTNKWKFLDDFREYVEWFDDTWRTPESHKSSKLRAKLLDGSMNIDEVNRILGLLGIVTNSLYINMISIIQGKEPANRFWTYGMSEDKKFGQ